MSPSSSSSYKRGIPSRMIGRGGQRNDNSLLDEGEGSGETICFMFPSFRGSVREQRPVTAVGGIAGTFKCILRQGPVRYCSSHVPIFLGFNASRRAHQLPPGFQTWRCPCQQL